MTTATPGPTASTLSADASTEAPTLERVTEPRELLRTSRGRMYAAFLALDCRREILRFETVHPDENGTPFDVYHGRCLRWRVPTLTADAANSLLDAVAPLAAQILAGYSEHVSARGNVVGELTDAAELVSERVRELCDGDAFSDADKLTSWDPWDLYAGEGRTQAIRRLKLTAQTTDDELHALADADEQQADEQGIIVSGCVIVLRHWRDELRDAEGSDDDGE